MKIKATVLNSLDTDKKVIMFEVGIKEIYTVMRMLTKGGFQVDYRKVGY